MTIIQRRQLAILIPLGASIVVASLWGGMLYDRVLLDPENTGFLNLLGFPFAAFLAVLGMSSSLWIDSISWRFTWRSAAYAGFVILVCASIFGTPNLHSSLVTFATLSAAVALGWGLERAGLPSAALLSFAAVVVTAASVVSGFGISEYVGYIARPPRDFSWRVFSTFVSPNFLAGFLAMTIPLTAACLIAAREKQIRLLMALGLTVQIICILLTGSRLGLASLVVASVVLIWLCLQAGFIHGISGRSRRLVGALIVMSVLLGSVPIAKRLFQSGGESHSSQFRVYTWKGTARMAASNPILGTGIGTFDTAYGPYAETAFTQHAHNSYLQLAAECGLPATILLLTAVFGAVGIGVWNASREPEPVVESETETGKSTLKKVHFVADAPRPAIWSENALRLLSAGAAAGMVGGLVHNLFDSDLYVPANALAFAALIGLIFSVDRCYTGLAESAPQTRRAPRRLLALLAVGFTLLYLGPYTLGRLRAYSAESSLLGTDLEGAISRYQAALRLNPLNSEYHLKLAGLFAASNQTGEAENAYQSATQVAQTGKANYQYARFLVSQNRIHEAVRYFEKARQLEPNNLQNLLALADVYARAKRLEDAKSGYRRIVDLHDTPFGKIRAVPELTEYEFGEAHRALGMMALANDDPQQAEAHLRTADAILGEYWGRRKNPMVQLQVRPEKALMVGEIYHQSLKSLATVLDKNRRAEESEKVRARLEALRIELEAERTALSAESEP